MRPQVLLRAGAHHLLDPLIDAQAIGLLALAGEVFERRMNDQAIAAAVLQAPLREGHHARLAQAGELGGGGNRRRLDAEQGHEDALLAPVVLVRRIPDGATGTQYLEHRANILALDGRGIEVMTLAATALDEVEQRVVVLAVHAIDGVQLAKQRRADFQSGEMHRHENHALPLGLCLLQMLQAFDVRQPRQARLGPPPAHGHLEEGDAGGGEVFPEQTLALGSALVRETQLQVACGDLPARAGRAVHQPAQRPPQLQLQAIRQLHHQPQQPKAKPQRPETRMKKIGAKAGAIH